MDYLIVKNNIIENTIVCDDEQTATFFGAVPSYDGAKIGDEYNPPEQNDEGNNTKKEFDLLLDAIIQ